MVARAGQGAPHPPSSRLPPRPAVIFLNHYSWFVCDGGGGVVANYACDAENDFNVLGGQRRAAG